MDHMHRTDMSWPAAIASGTALLGVGGYVGLQGGKKLQYDKDFNKFKRFESLMINKRKDDKTGFDSKFDNIWNVFFDNLKVEQELKTLDLS